MAYPAKQKTWTNTPNNVITFVSLVLTTGGYMKGMADFLLANGYTCKGSCDGTTGTMDGTNRWTTVALASTRGATTVAANSWMVLTDGNGCNICLSFVGATDDVARFSFSAGGNFVLAGTATFTPTATDESVLATGITVIGATASLDRIWQGWVDSSSKMCRFLINRNGAMVGFAWGVELINPRTTRTISPAVWGFCYLASQFANNNNTSGFTLAYSANTRGGLARMSGTNVQVGGGMPAFQAAVGTLWSDVQTELQGGAGYPMWGPLSLGSNLASFQGVLAYTFDWWTGRQSPNNGDTYDTKNYVQFGGTGGIVWPWDGVSTPNTGAAGPATQPGFAQANLAELSYGVPLNGYGIYVPLAYSRVTPTGPSALKSYARRPGAQVLRLSELSADPSPETGMALLYQRTINGVQALFACFADGTIYQVGAG